MDCSNPSLNLNSFICSPLNPEPVMTTIQFRLPYAPIVNRVMGKKHHWRLVMAKRALSKLDIASSYISANQLFIEPVMIDGVRRDGFAVMVVSTDLHGIRWTLDHFKIYSMHFDHTFVLLCVDTNQLLKKLVHFSVLQLSEVSSH